MGGLGSGKTYGRGRAKRRKKLFTSSLPSFDVSDLMKRFNGFNGVVSLSWKGEEFKIDVRIETDSLHLCGHGLLPTSIKLSPITCFKGVRYFACCSVCSRRVVNLYLNKYENHRFFACRHCFKMSYWSQNATLSSRLYKKYGHIRDMINNDPWHKPKWMRKKTFSRLRSEYFDLDEKEQIADFFSLRNNRDVDRIFNRYGSALVAAEAWEMHYFGNHNIEPDRFKKKV
jgi:hypothetical protein